ncbi:MAG: acyl-CoA dehydrogenase family protein [Burkholderiaceae bacterium]|nr:acyl-CoA dehydrogenase family protein [Burkholderiaceae bacterium]
MNASPFFTEEHLMFKDTVNRFVEEHCSRKYARDNDVRREYPFEAYAAMAEQGYFGLCVPEEHGGMGADVIYRAILQEGLARYAFDMGAVYGLTCWGIETLLRFGTDAQRAKYIPPALAGKIRMSISMTEPNAGSDLSGIALKAEDKGDHYLLNGQKVFATAAGVKDNVIVLAARTGPPEPQRHSGITMFLVPCDTPGLECRKMPVLSRRMSGTYECFYTDVKVPKENMVGELHKGWKILGAFLVAERIGGAAMYVGNAQTAVDDAIRYAGERRQIGQPIGEFQAIKHALVDAATEIDAARLMTYQAAWMDARGIPALKEASMAKLFASEAGLRATSLGMQVLGGYAQLPEYDMERYWRDAKQNTVSSGTSQIQRNIIAKAIGLK